MRLVPLFLAALWPAIAPAQSTSFDLSIRGLNVGVLTMAAEETAATYRVAGRIANAGLTNIIRRFSYNGQAQGAVRGNRLSPSYYEGVADTGRRSSEVVIAYPGGVPEVRAYTSEREAGPDSPAPDTQGGTVDPLTGVYALLRDVAPDRACETRVIIFDGRRQSSLVAQSAGMENGLPVCAGRYERRLGYTADEVERHRFFNFVLRYQPGPDGRLQVREVVFDSLYGTAAITRQ